MHVSCDSTAPVPGPWGAAMWASTLAPGASRDLWATLLASSPTVPARNPTEMRALSFVASLGPSRPPHTGSDDDGLIDLAGEEAFLAYLASLVPPPVLA